MQKKYKTKANVYYKSRNILKDEIIYLEEALAEKHKIIFEPVLEKPAPVEKTKRRRKK